MLGYASQKGTNETILAMHVFRLLHLHINVVLSEKYNAESAVSIVASLVIAKKFRSCHSMRDIFINYFVQMFEANARI